MLHEKHENILVYNISYKTLIGAKPLPVRFNKIDGFIRVCDETIYLVLYGSQKLDSIYNRIRYFIGGKSGTTYVFPQNWKDQSRFLWFFTSRKNINIP